MMKFLFMLFFMLFMLKKNKINSFYFNMLYILNIMFMMNYYFMENFYLMSMYMVIDNYSFLLILLSIWIISLMLMSLNNFESLKIFMFIIMLIILFMFFSMKNLLMFYFFFELSLIPIFMIIIYWGYNPERMGAAFYMLMYTLLISLPLLIYIMMIYLNNYNLDFSLLLLKNKMNLSFWSYMIIIGAFLIKLPIYLFHIWLPKAHVEAPVYGSMILAAILLKLGSYGLMRIMMIFLKSMIKYNNFIISISLIGSLIISLICFVQIDMKSMVAYSSIVHMNLMLASLLTLSKMSFFSTYLIMISHGLCSSGLFYMVNLYYYRSSSRLMMFNKGMINILPSFSIWWFMLCSSNFSFPLSFSFFSEIMLLSVLINWSINFIFFLIFINFFSSIYSLYLFSYIQHGELSIMNKFNSGNFKEFIVMIFHYFPLLIMLFNMNLF
uniref:NADH dehydrogenase subunit 4 n=1 Tax=Pachycondyla annamita TaxID=613577 RepID=UPI002551D012|nr:NADH dehydrogenase subunit 4 [Pachycondyla annamita]WGF22861.1 NADH dehydrogenase subunit 4 [Pachycondyla annamita]